MQGFTQVKKHTNVIYVERYVGGCVWVSVGWCGCGKTYTRPTALKDHMMTYSGEKPYKCDTCGKAFIQAFGLTDYKKTHTDEKP